MSFYTVSRVISGAPTAGSDVFTLSSATGRRIELVYIGFKSQGTTAGANDYQVVRSTGGSTGGGALTPQGMTGDEPTPAFTVETTWSTQPTVVAGTPLRFSAPGNGGIDKMIFDSTMRLQAFNGSRISVRHVNGTSPIIVDAIVNEI